MRGTNSYRWPSIAARRLRSAGGKRRICFALHNDDTLRPQRFNRIIARDFETVAFGTQSGEVCRGSRPLIRDCFKATVPVKDTLLKRDRLIGTRKWHPYLPCCSLSAERACFLCARF
jgi:hypothetical protein